MDDQKPPSRTLLGSFVSSYFMSRRLDDHIRKLCAQAVAATDPVDMNAILQQLTAALHEHVVRMRTNLASNRSFPPERRHSQP